MVDKAEMGERMLVALGTPAPPAPVDSRASLSQLSRSPDLRGYATRGSVAAVYRLAVVVLAIGMLSCADTPTQDCAATGTCPAVDGTTADTTTEEEAAGPSPDATAIDATVTDASAIDATATDATADTRGGDAPAEGASDAAPDVVMCDPTQAPRDEACVLDEAYGVFVATPDNGGSDTVGDGSRGRPYASIGRALASLAGRALASLAGKPRVYVCDGTYAEAIALSSPTSLYGGLACPRDDAGVAQWSYADAQAQVIAPQNAIGLVVSGDAGPISVEDFAVTAPDAAGQDDAGNGLSSIAVFVNGASVTFRRCSFVAGSADNGRDGITGANYPANAATAPDGGANDGGAGGAGGSIVCTDGTSSIGGAGGSTNPGPPEGDGGTGASSPVAAASAIRNGAGGSGDDGVNGCRDGGSGADGVPGDSGLPVGSVGSLSSRGWTPSAASMGANGAPGQGGGGGGASALAVLGTVLPYLGGTGGGAGGCGGAGGTGGTGGGGSIALACIGSSVTLEACSLRTATAGNGGNGAAGELGQGGGVGGPVKRLSAICGGGIGGNGAGGGGGAGGTGGISVCIVYRGTLPGGSFTCTAGIAGAPGSGGRGESGGANALGPGQPGLPGPAGLAGIAEPILQLP
jgi:hypothetical protein